MLSRGMTPNVTLHHFTAPQWFMDIGGWTKAENIHIFVEYAIKVRGMLQVLRITEPGVLTQKSRCGSGCWALGGVVRQQCSTVECGKGSQWQRGWTKAMDILITENVLLSVSSTSVDCVTWLWLQESTY